MEANVIYRIVKGDEQAFDEFMDYYSSALYHYAYGIVGCKESAEEVVSDVFFEVWKSRKTILEIESMAAWLRTITYRKAVSCLRHENITPSQVSLDDVENFTVSPVSPPDSDMIANEEIEELNRAIGELPPKCRHVFFLAKIDRLPYKEISKMLEISVATINYHVGFAMETLKRKLSRHGPPFG